MMTPAEVQDTIGKLTYWPGWQFAVGHDAHLGPMLRILATVPDRDNPGGGTVDLGISARIPPQVMRDRRELCRWVLWRLEEAAIHEVREGLRYDGQLVDDPHASE